MSIKSENVRVTVTLSESERDWCADFAEELGFATPSRGAAEAVRRYPELVAENTALREALEACARYLVHAVWMSDASIPVHGALDIESCGEPMPWERLLAAAVLRQLEADPDALRRYRAFCERMGGESRGWKPQA